MKSIRQIIQEEMQEVAHTLGYSVDPSPDENSPIWDTGLDSLGFALLVARLEERLGFDPFVASSEAVYPSTLKEFINMYASYLSTNLSTHESMESTDQ